MHAAMTSDWCLLSKSASHWQLQGFVFYVKAQFLANFVNCHCSSWGRDEEEAYAGGNHTFPQEDHTLHFVSHYQQGLFGPTGHHRTR